MSPLLPLIKFLFKWPLSLLALFFILKITSVNITKIELYLSHINYILLIYGILCLLIYFFLRSFLWQQILKAHGHHLLFKEVSYLWGISELKRFVPGNIWALATRTMLFSEKQIPKKVIISSLFTESQIILLSSTSLSLFSLNTFIVHLFPNIIINQLFIPFSVICVFFILFFYIFHSYLVKKNTQAPKTIQRQLLWYFRDVVLPNFNAHQSFLLILIGAVSFLFFGIGTYLTIVSIVFLDPTLLLALVGFFAFSYVVGYVSFITPMGLGVREGVMTWGLSFVISIAASGIASIYTRLILVVSELLFLTLSYLWRNTSSGFFRKIEDFITKHKQEFVVVFFIIVYCMYFTSATFLRFENFYAGRFDLGNMDQTVWNTMQGRIFELTSPNGTEIISRLSIHADFILILLSPFYLVWSDARMLLLLQTIILANGAFFVFFIAKKILQNKTVALIFSLAYLLNPYVNHTNLYDFHSVTLATTFLLGTFYFLLSNQYVWFLIFLLLSALTKEHIWIITGLFGAFLFLRTSYKRKLGLIIFVFSALTFYYLVWHAIPASYGGSHFALEYYSDFGATPTSIVRNIFLSPLTILQTFLQEERVYYLYQLLLPLGFIPLLSPFTLFLAAPDLFINLLSNNKQLYQIYYQYSAAITPFLFISAIFGVKTILKFFPQIPHQVVICYLLLVTCYSAYLFGPLPGAKKPNIDMFVKPAANKDIINKTLAQIPENKKVAATNNLGAHLTHRQYLFTIPVGMKESDIIAFLLGDVHAQPSPEKQKEMVVELKNNPTYKILAELDNFIVFEKINPAPFENSVIRYINAL